MGAVTPPFLPRFGSGIPSGAAPPGTIYFDRANQYAMYVFDANNGLWNPMGAFGSYPPAVVNSAVAPNSQTFTLAGAPTNGNLLIAITLSNAAKTANTGWTQQFTTITSNGQSLQVFSKVASGDGATLTPITAAVTVGTLSGFEIAHAAGTFDVFAGNATAGSVASDSVTITPSGAGRLIIGMSTICENNTGVFPTITGATRLALSADVNRQGCTFSLYPAVNGANLITGNVSTNRFMSIMGIAIL